MAEQQLLKIVYALDIKFWGEEVTSFFSFLKNIVFEN